MVFPGVVQGFKIITEKGSTRIARAAFEFAHKHGRKKIHAIHKANIMKLADGLFLKCCKQVAEQFPEIAYAEHIVDNTCNAARDEPLAVRRHPHRKPLRRYSL